ncbi:ABC transporter substrate-binding protein [Halovivax gelatinilyticus]|uniref:ABC transporter substrate-binding protein n=1 Tax=Halovivax gelatinilyticus TaxID=2961597 RepID=UPI0020CA3A9F|nr:ABC transporter substrate-binding protein [Halovivax gelatinilyticus]
MRVVTTLPSATELVCALGIEPVGVSHECDYPPRVEDYPRVTRSTIDASGTSAEIDEQVLDAQAHGGVYDVDVEALDRLDPDVVITQDVCDVCAVDERVVAAAVDEIDADPALVPIDAHRIGEVLDDLERLGDLLDRPDRAASVRADLESRLDAVRDAAPEPDERPRVVVFDWTDPVMVAAHWVPELVEIAGGRYELAEAGTDARPRQWEEIVDYDPEVAIVAPCGFDLAQTAANLSDLTDREGWDELTAVETGQVYAIDGHHYLNRPGPRLVDAAERLARVIHPDRFGDATDPGDLAVPVETLRRRVDA